MKTKKLIFLFSIIFGLQISIAQESESSISVSVTNITSNNGTIRVALYNNKADFLGKPYKSISVKAKKEGVKVLFENIKQGEYAISLYHDEDDNQMLNTFFKIPTEPYGTSNNAKARFGPPQWEDAIFIVSDKIVIQNISL